MDREETQLPQGDWAKIQSWALPGLVIVLLLTGIDMLVHFAHQRNQSEQILSSTLPSDYQRTISSLIASTGQSCQQVCSMVPQASAPGTTSLQVECGTRVSDSECHVTSRYRIQVTPSGEPSR